MESVSAGNDKTEDVTSCRSHYFKCPQNFSLEVETIEEHTNAKAKGWNSSGFRILYLQENGYNAEAAQGCDHENCPCLLDFHLPEENQLWLMIKCLP